MKKRIDQISAIIYKCLQGLELLQEEQQILDSWLNASESNRQVFKNVQNEKEFTEYFSIVSDKEGVESAFKNFTARLLKTSEKMDSPELLTADIQSADMLSRIIPPVHRIHFLKTAWFRYAAAAIFIVSLGAYFWNTQRKTIQNQVVKDSPAPVQNDVLPGSDRATLTLSNGEKVELKPTLHQTITDGPLAIYNKDGQLTYGKSDGVGYNTVSTPKGGQYQVTLPDGTHVWLNAASSITYPTAFTGLARSVSMTGEAYFEVAKNAKQPFLVKIDETVVKVLGTHFNVNDYAEEGPMRTTLFEGSVEVNRSGYIRVMKPGQQAAITGNGIEIKTNINPEQVLAWKEGKFYFGQDDLKTILRQFERWYDVEVIYEGPLKNRKFFGIVSKNSSLSEVLKLLQDSDIKFNIKGKKLYVQSD